MFIKTRRIIAILVLSLVSVVMGQYAHADTNVGGNITADTTWILANSPYIITSTVQVLEGVKLTIEPGVEIKFDPDADFNVGGELIAIGTQSQMITFKENESHLYYAFLRFTSTSVAAEFDTELNYISGCIINFCTFEIPIRILSEIPLYIDDNELTGTGYKTITLNGSDGSVVKNNVMNGTNGGTAIDVESNSFIQNNTIKYYGKAINASNGSIIKNNLIEYGGAVNLGQNIIFEHNTITKCGYELDPVSIILFRGTNTVFRHNTVVGNLVNPNEYSGDFWTIKIMGNTSGTIISKNDIYDNNCKYEIKNQSENDIDATYNYWGTTDTAAIADKIYDYYDYIYFGKVIYEPIATQPYFVTDPLPDIKANSQDGPITVSSGMPVSITVSLNPGGYANQDADWWVVESTPSGIFNYYNLSAGAMVPGLLPTHKGPLFNLGTMQLLNSSNLAVGMHTFYFGVDLNMNGSLDMNFLYYDSVGISVTGP